MFSTETVVVMRKNGAGTVFKNLRGYGVQCGGHTPLAEAAGSEVSLRSFVRKHLSDESSCASTITHSATSLAFIRFKVLLTHKMYRSAL